MHILQPVGETDIYCDSSFPGTHPRCFTSTILFAPTALLDIVPLSTQINSYLRAEVTQEVSKLGLGQSDSNFVFLHTNQHSSRQCTPLKLEFHCDAKIWRLYRPMTSHCQLQTQCLLKNLSVFLQPVHSLTLQGMLSLR